jgi:hypothetical protein
MSTRRIRLPRSPKISEPQLPHSLQPPMDPIVWHETGGWSVGWHDEAERFPSHAFARDVWLESRTTERDA